MKTFPKIGSTAVQSVVHATNAFKLLEPKEFYSRSKRKSNIGKRIPKLKSVVYAKRHTGNFVSLSNLLCISD